MRNLVRGLAVAAVFFALTPRVANADPVVLKLSFFSSDRASIYRTQIKPFVDAVNAEGSGLLHIDVAFSGALGRDPAQQAQLVLDGKADLAWVVPGYRPDIFPDDSVISLPGLFDSSPDATRVYGGLARSGALRGYDKFVVVSYYAPAPETFVSRVPIASLADINGLRVRVSNPMEVATITRLGGKPVELPINQTASAISSGDIDAALLPSGELQVEFGVARVAPNHYLLGISTVPLTILMNRAVYTSLPKAAQDIITKYGGQWAADRYLADTRTANDRIVADLQADPKRKFVVPSVGDREQAAKVFKAIVADWLATSPGNADLLARVRADLSKSK